jgi:hypothetical protein
MWGKSLLLSVSVVLHRIVVTLCLDDPGNDVTHPWGQQLLCSPE